MQQRHGPDGAERRNDALGAVVLLDEIDKADPDLPNNLLAPLSLYEFTVTETGRRVCLPVQPGANTGWRGEAMRLPLIVITTNSERELPEAFLRRCIDIKLTQPTTAEELTRIARIHFGEPADEASVMKAIEKVAGSVAAQMAAKGRIPSTAEILDTIRICLRLEQEGTDYHQVWDKVQDMALVKTNTRRF